MKKIISIALSFILIFSILSISLTASADTGSEADTVLQTIRALGIIVGDENGNMNLGGYVTRAEFAKMMVAASTFKDSVGGTSGVSLFKDVKQGHWAVEYIKLAVSNGWFVGYSDGTFRPDNNITLEEAATAILRILSYTSSDLTGAFPYAQLSKFNALGLNENLLRKQGELVTRYDCMIIFYNLMTTANKSGTVYGKSLGYTINSSGELDYSSLVAANIKGPYVLQNGSSLSANLPFSTSNITVYLDGTLADISAAAAYDVYYYNANLRTVWLYDTRVIGTYTAATPSRLSPTSVTVAGNSYKLATSAATYKMSSMGSFNIGDTVTLLLGADGSIVDVLPIGTSDQNNVTTTYYGIVTSSATASYTDSSGSIVSENNVKIACTDGVIRQFAGSATVGSKVEVNISGSRVTVSSLSARGISGMVNSDGTVFGNYSLAGNIEILDTNSNGAYAVIYPSRLAGIRLTSDDVYYYETDSNGKLTKLILNDVTGDVYSYGILTSVKEKDGSGNVKGSYNYIIKGTAGTLGSAPYYGGVNEGPTQFRYNGDGTLAMLKNLSSFTIDSINELTISSGSQKYKLAENAQVYLYSNDNYSLVNVNTVSDTKKYSLTGYYDDYGYAAGGKVRIIIATLNS